MPSRHGFRADRAVGRDPVKHCVGAGKERTPEIDRNRVCARREDENPDRGGHGHDGQSVCERMPQRVGLDARPQAFVQRAALHAASGRSARVNGRGRQSLIARKTVTATTARTCTFCNASAVRSVRGSSPDEERSKPGGIEQAAIEPDHDEEQSEVVHLDERREHEDREDGESHRIAVASAPGGNEHELQGRRRRSPSLERSPWTSSGRRSGAVPRPSSCRGPSLTGDARQHVRVVVQAGEADARPGDEDQDGRRSRSECGRPVATGGDEPDEERPEDELDRDHEPGRRARRQLDDPGSARSSASPSTSGSVTFAVWMPMIVGHQRKAIA